MRLSAESAGINKSIPLAVLATNQKTAEIAVCHLGTPSWIRTSDLRLRSPLLYPAELSGHTSVIIPYFYTGWLLLYTRGSYYKDKRRGYGYDRLRTSAICDEY